MRVAMAKKILSKWQLYLFLLLPLIYILVFSYYPMTGIQLAFKKFMPVQGIWGSPWVGFKNFEKFFTSYQFPRVMKNTLTLSFYGLFAGFPMPIILALALNALRSDRYRKFIQTVTYLPHFISMVVMIGILYQMFNPRIGLLAGLFSVITGKENIDLLAIPEAFPHLYVWSGIWQSMGYSAIIYIAALAGVDPELHEAAEIDGASRFARVRHIDFPSILPTAVIMLILSAGQIMNVGFEKVFLMQNKLNAATSEVISTYVYKVSIAASQSDFSFGTAIGLFNSLINFALLITVNFISKKLNDTSLW